MTEDPGLGASSSRRRDLLTALGEYRRARVVFLEALGCRASNRDPLAEFSERVVAALLGGDLPASRVQRGYDVVADGERVQVRYLANPAARWVNEHLVDVRGDCDAYALVVVEDLDPKHVLVFPALGLAEVCAALGKRHPDQDRTLQLTMRNYQQILSERERFVGLGVDVFDLSL